MFATSYRLLFGMLVAVGCLTIVGSAEAGKGLIQMANEAAEKLEQLLKQESLDAEKRIKELNVYVESYDWALRRFEDRRPYQPSAAGQSIYGKLSQSRAVYRDKFLHFQEAARGEIKSGRALNFFLDACAETAIHHDATLKKILLQQPIPIGGPRFNREDATAALTIQKLLIESVCGERIFNAENLAHLYVQRGLTGAPLRFRLAQQEPLPLEWPDLLRNNPKYAPLLKNMVDTRTELLERLRSDRDAGLVNQGVPPGLQLKLRNAADALADTFERDVEKFYAAFRDPDKADGITFSASLAPDVVLTRRYLHEMRGGTARLITTRNAADILLESPVVGQRAINVQELLVYMSRNGLRFAEVDVAGESKQLDVFNELCRYYVDLQAMATALREQFNEYGDAVAQKEAAEKQLKVLMTAQYGIFSAMMFKRAEDIPLE